jgi:hypothetical protein
VLYRKVFAAARTVMPEKTRIDSPVVRIFAQAATERRRIAAGAVGTDHVLLYRKSERTGAPYSEIASVGFLVSDPVIKRRIVSRHA